VIVFGPLIQVAMIAVEIYMWVVIASAILSWLIAFNVVNTSNRLVFTIWDFLTRITEPALRRIRRFMPNLGGVDISPVILILALYFIQQVLVRILIWLSRGGY
jgi:YggT family protein